MKTHHEVHLSVEERLRSVYAIATTNTFFAFFLLLRLSPPLSFFLRRCCLSSDLFSYPHLSSPSSLSSPVASVPKTQNIRAFSLFLKCFFVTMAVNLHIHKIHDRLKLFECPLKKKI